MREAIFLVGFMGSGKSSVGKALAGLLRWEFLDTDDLVARQEGRIVDRIFRESGEGYFREAEWKALLTLAGRRRLVVGTGGGLFLGSEQRAFMKKHGTTVWLDVPLDELHRRVGEGERRPLWRPEDPVSFRAMYEKRRASYALAEHRVVGWPGTPREVAERIAEKLGKGEEE